MNTEIDNELKLIEKTSLLNIEEQEDSLLNNIYNTNVLYKAFKNCTKNTKWKEETQRFEMNLLKELNILSNSLKNNTYKPKPCKEFIINERGKTRYIKALDIRDRIVQRAFCDEILIPLLYKYLIYDNGASVKGKGISFTRKRLEEHLWKYYKNNNNSNEGYILLMDYSSFFDNIRHDLLIKELSEKIKDKKIMNFFVLLLSEFKIDVSYMNEQEYECCLDNVFKQLEYKSIPKEFLIGQKYMYKSMGIGSQISQICGIFFPTKIDNYIKIVCGEKYYGRYMDDFYIISKDKEHLIDLSKEIEKQSKKLGLHINMKKTKIKKLTNFNFLKVKYSLKNNGKIVKKAIKQNYIRERRKLKKYKEKLDNNMMTYKEIENSYKSWKGNIKKFNNYYMLERTDEIYNELYIKNFINNTT